MLGQALLEKAMLDTLGSQLSTLTREMTHTFQQRPWLWVLIAVVTFIILIRRNK